MPNRKSKDKAEPPALGGHALPVGLLFPRWLGMLFVGVAAAVVVSAIAAVCWLILG